MSPAKIVVHKAIELGIPLVIDADGIYLISCDPDIIRGIQRTMLQNNQELGRKNWAIRSLACSTLLALVIHHAGLICLFAHSITHFR